MKKQKKSIKKSQEQPNMVNNNMKNDTGLLGLWRSHIEDEKAFWCYLIARRKYHLDTTIICAAAREEGVEMYNTTTLEAFKIVQQLWEYLKKHYQDHKTKRDEYLLSKENLESDTGDEEKANAIKNVKRGERRNQCYQILGSTREQ